MYSSNYFFSVMLPFSLANSLLESTYNSKPSMAGYFSIYNTFHLADLLRLHPGLEYREFDS